MTLGLEVQCSSRLSYKRMWWAGMESNHPSQMTADLQSAPLPSTVYLPKSIPSSRQHGSESNRCLSFQIILPLNYRLLGEEGKTFFLLLLSIKFQNPIILRRARALSFSSQRAIVNDKYSRLWCGKRDSNPHAFQQQILSLWCLPIPPFPHEAAAPCFTSFLQRRTDQLDKIEGFKLFFDALASIRRRVHNLQHFLTSALIPWLPQPYINIISKI